MSKRGDASLIIIVILALLLPLVLLGGSTVGYAETRHAPLVKGGGDANSGCISPLLPKINDQGKFAEAINNYIKGVQPNSPLVGLGKNFVDAGASNGVNPAWVVAIAQKESSLGIMGFAATHANNSYGRTATSSQPHVDSPTGRKWYKYDSFAQSTGGQSEYLKRRYIDKGLVTLEAIIYTYAPPSENDTERYILEIKQTIGKIMSLAGAAVDCPVSSKGDNSQGPPGADVGMCKDSRELPVTIPAKNNRRAHTALIKKLEQLWEKNKTWRLTEGCPPTSTHQDANHYNGRAVDIAINPPGSATQEKIAQLLKDVREVGFDDVLDEYHTKTTYTTAGHIHLEWHGK